MAIGKQKMLMMNTITMSMNDKLLQIVLIWRLWLCCENSIWHFGGKNHYQHHDEDNGTLRQDERLGRGFPRRRPALFLHFNICWLSHVYWERHNVMTHVTIERNMTHQVMWQMSISQKWLCQHIDFKGKTALKLIRARISAETCNFCATLLWSIRALPRWSW